MKSASSNAVPCIERVVTGPARYRDTATGLGRLLLPFSGAIDYFGSSSHTNIYAGFADAGGETQRIGSFAIDVLKNPNRQKRGHAACELTLAVEPAFQKASVCDESVPEFTVEQLALLAAIERAHGFYPRVEFDIGNQDAVSTLAEILEQYPRRDSHHLSDKMERLVPRGGFVQVDSRIIHASEGLLRAA